MTAIKVENLSRIYEYSKKEPGLKGSVKSLFKKKKLKKVAVEDFSFEIKEGEFIGLIGPNGAGKTTLIKMLTGIIQPSSGKLSVLGHNPAKLTNEFKKEYAIIMGQKSQLWWDLPAIDTFLLNKELYQIPEAQFQENVTFLTELFGVVDLLDVPVRRLSLGERMKMELISSLLHDPKILFLDEPTIGLDTIAQKQIRMLLKKVNEEKGVTVLLTSHYIEDIKRLCSRVMVINHGQKIYEGTLDTLLDRYKEQKIVSIAFSTSTELELEEEVEWISKSPFKAVFKVQKDRVSQILQQILNKYEVEDINIEEEDIENLVETIYKTSQVIRDEKIS